MSTFGTVEFQSDSHPVLATLGDDRTFAVACDDPPTRQWVELVLGEIAARRHGPEHGRYGPGQLREAARIFGGTVMDEPADADAEYEPGRIY
jgi:hypothetical protein